MSSIGIEDDMFGEDGKNVFSWSKMLEKETIEMLFNQIRKNTNSFIPIVLGGSILSIMIYFLFYLIGRKWYSSLKKSRMSFSDSTTNLIWCLFFIPICYSGWRLFLETVDYKSKKMIIFYAHLAVNLIYTMSIWVIKNFSLGILILIILIGIAMYSNSILEEVDPFLSALNTPYLFFLLVFLVQFSAVFWLNEGKYALKETMKDGLFSSAFSTSGSKIKIKEKKQKGENFPGSKKTLSMLKEKKKEDELKEKQEEKEKKEEKEKQEALNKEKQLLAESNNKK